MPVTFAVHAGGFYRFDGITVQGLERLPDDFLRQRFKELRGEPYNPERIDKLYRELIRTGLFRYVSYEPVALPGGEVRLDVKVEEAKAKEAGAYVGYDTDVGGVFGVSFTNRNLFGTGRPLTLSAQYAQRGLAGEILYEDPWLFDTRFLLRMRIYALSEEQDDYTQREAGARLELSRKLTEQLTLGSFLHVKRAMITDTSIEPSLRGPTRYDLGTMGVTQTFERLKNPAFPPRGLSVNSALSFSAGDSDVSFGRATLQLSYYVPIGKTILALGARFGTLFAAGGLDSVPLDERFYAGGSTTVRSFREHELGPQDSGGRPIGGLSRSVFNAEYIFPLFGDLKGAVFADAGSVSEQSFAFTSDLRFAIGTGLRYQLPIGPLRFDYGRNPSPRGDEASGAFHLSFGFAF